MSALPSLLAEVLAEHDTKTYLDDERFACGCGAIIDGQWRFVLRCTEAHHSHVAAELTKAVAAWIEADERVELVLSTRSGQIGRYLLAALARSAGAR
jgi:hypothetical protein